MSETKFKFVALTGVSFMQDGKRKSVSPAEQKSTGLFNAPFEPNTTRRLLDRQHIRLATAADHAALAALRAGHVVPEPEDEPEVVEPVAEDEPVVEDDAETIEAKRVAAEQAEADRVEKARIKQDKADQKVIDDAAKAKLKADAAAERANQKEATAAAKAKLKADAQAEPDKSTGKSSDLL